MNRPFTSRLGLALLGCIATAGAVAQEAAPASPFSANLAFTTNYVSRGFTQSWSRPALQGGVDYVHASGIYLGTWLSTLSDSEFRDGHLEWDLYGGYNGTVGALGYTAGLAYYAYPGSSSPLVDGKRYDYAELKLGLNHGSLSATYYRTLTQRWFGTFDDARGSGYVDLSFNPQFGDGYTLQLHAGMGRVRHHREANWHDVKLGVSKALPQGWSVGGAVTRAWDRDAYWTGADFDADPQGTVYTKRLGKTALALTVSKTF